MTARTRQLANLLDSLSQPGPEAIRFDRMIENNREWFDQLRADREQREKENERVS